MAKQETQKSLVVVATIVLATNIVCRLFKSMYEREKNQPQRKEGIDPNDEATSRERAIEIAGVHEPRKLFGTYYFLRGDLERAKSYYKIKDEL